MCLYIFVGLKTLRTTYIGVTVRGGALILLMKVHYVNEGQLFEPYTDTTTSSSFPERLPFGSPTTCSNPDCGQIMEYLNVYAFLPRRC